MLGWFRDYWWVVLGVIYVGWELADGWSIPTGN